MPLLKLHSVYKNYFYTMEPYQQSSYSIHLSLWSSLCSLLTNSVVWNDTYIIAVSVKIITVEVM